MLFLCSISLLLVSAELSHGLTNAGDVAALQNMFSNFNSPSRLTSWKLQNGDPCSQMWKGVQCSGSSVTQLNLEGLGLSGNIGYMMDQLTSLTVLDLSDNYISGQMPYQLPPHLEKLNLGNNNFQGGLPYSISMMTNLTYLNISHNHLSQSLSDIFLNLDSLSVVDLSFNTITGALPQSMSSLTSLVSLYLENNQFSGGLNVLANLFKLQDLDVENNQFSGWVPDSFKSIRSFKSNGNSFSPSPAPPPPQFMPSPPVRVPPTGPAKNTNPPSPSGPSAQSSGSVLNGGAIAGIAIGGILGILAAFLVIVHFCWKCQKVAIDQEKTSLGPDRILTSQVVNMEPEQKSLTDAVLKPPPLVQTVEEPLVKSPPTRRVKSSIAATVYSVADLQQATNSFSQENLVGEGAVGRVYKAELSSGKLLAVKKIDIMVCPSVQSDEGFMEILANISRLRHANIAELVGYCIEHGQRLLAYEWFSKGALSDMLHADDEISKSELTWNVRVKIALGTARALEYLHEVCQPSVVHKNFKSANILLDDKLNPHLSDCGVAAFLPNRERQVSTQMMNSFGYSAPEYAMSGIYTWKSDVYSFGVVMLELLTGRKPVNSAKTRSDQSLVRWATPQLHDIDALAKMVDPSLKGMYAAKSLSRFADIIALCVQPEPEFRPPMSEVVQSLVRLMQRATLNKRRSGEEQRGSNTHVPTCN